MKYAISKLGRRLLIEETPAVATMFRAMPQHCRDGMTFREVPYKSSYVKILRNLGSGVPAPIMRNYDWGGQNAFESQKQTAALLTIERRAYVLSSMGVGKTRAALFAFDFLKQEGEAKRMLVVAPLSTLVSVWENEIFVALPHLKTVVLHGTRKYRQKMLAQSDADVFIINHDGVKVVTKELTDQFDVICIDELHEFRNAQSDRWKAMYAVSRSTPYIWGMTGSPTPNEPTDAHGQCRLITPNTVPKSFRTFRSMTMEQYSQFTWGAREDALATVHSVMQPAVRFKLEDCHDLPPQTFSRRDAQMDTAQAKAYKAMLEELATEIKAGTITAANEGAKLQKLLQLSTGFVYDSEKTGHMVGGTDRFKVMLDIIRTSEKKTIVFSQYKYMVNLVARVLNAKGIPTAVVHGETPASERASIFATFQHSDEPKVISAQPGTIALGLTLTAASTIIWNGPTTRPDQWTQANGRIYRRGQDSHTHVVMLQATSAERRQFTRLEKKQKAEGLLLEMFEQGDFHV